MKQESIQTPAKQSRLTGRQSVKRMVIDALLAAMYVVLSSYVSIKLPTVELSLSSIPIAMTALLFGPTDAVAVAIVGSFLEQVLSPYGLTATAPIWMMPVILEALTCGFIALAFRYSGKRVHDLIAVVASEIVLTAANTCALYLDGWIMQYPVKALNIILPVRLINMGVRAALSLVVILFLLEPIRMIADKNGKITKQALSEK